MTQRISRKRLIASLNGRGLFFYSHGPLQYSVYCKLCILLLQKLLWVQWWRIQSATPAGGFGLGFIVSALPKVHRACRAFL